MQEVRLEFELRDWASEDLENLAEILEVEVSADSLLYDLLEKIRVLYHAPVKTSLKRGASHLHSKLLGIDATAVRDNEIDQLPSYNELQKASAKHLGVLKDDPDLEVLELYVSQAVIVNALGKMEPSQRLLFFDEKIEVSKLASAAGIEGKNYSGPVSTMAALGAAQASGFGVYVTTTTALGFVTNAVGITLPFAAYTGVSSTIAFLIGPVGWLAAGFWVISKAIAPSWKKLLPAVIYISSVRARRKFSSIEGFGQGIDDPVA